MAHKLYKGVRELFLVHKSIVPCSLPVGVGRDVRLRTRVHVEMEGRWWSAA